MSTFSPAIRIIDYDLHTRTSKEREREVEHSKDISTLLTHQILATFAPYIRDAVHYYRRWKRDLVNLSLHQDLCELITNIKVVNESGSVVRL